MNGIEKALAVALAVAVQGALATDMDREAQIRGGVVTAHSGVAELTCDDPMGWKFDMKATDDDGRDVVTVTISSPTNAQPPRFGVFFRVPGSGVQYVWTSNFGRDGFRLWPQLWRGRLSKDRSQFVRETPIAVGFNSQEVSPVALACSETFHSLAFGLYADDRTCDIVGRCEFFMQPVAPLKSYSVSVLLDRRRRNFADTVRACSAWVAARNGLKPEAPRDGDMTRCADCPADPCANRRRVCDLRLTSGGTAVQSDGLVWSEDESPEGAALPILNALYSTIRHPTALATLKPVHREVVLRWIAFSREHREALLEGRFAPHHPESGYPWIESESAAERVITVYSKEVCAPSGAADRPVWLVNATGGSGTLCELIAPATVEYFDVFGKATGRVRAAKGLYRLNIPNAGCAKIAW